MKKCKFAKSKIKLLSYRISAKGMTPNSGKVIVIKALEWPTIILKLRGFLEVVVSFENI